MDEVLEVRSASLRPVDDMVPVNPQMISCLPVW
jgi:hypothetical protein